MKKLVIGLLIVVAIVATAGLYLYWQASQLTSQPITDDMHIQISTTPSFASATTPLPGATIYLPKQ